MAIKTVFETSFALEKLLQKHGYTLAEPKFSMKALGTSVNVYSSEKQIHNNELILEVLPPYYFNFQFNNFGQQELQEAQDIFFQQLEALVKKIEENCIKLKAIILHGGSAGKAPHKAGKVVVKTYTSKQDDDVIEIFKFDDLKKKLPELEGIFE